MSPHTLPELPYSFDALEPYYDARTLELHYSKHHQGYVTGLNAALTKLTSAQETGDYGLIKHLEREIAFHGGGHTLHSIFWTNLKPGGGGRPNGALAEAIDRSFGSFDRFDALIRSATVAVEGSGWGALIADTDTCGLAVIQIEKHQNQVLAGWVPILVIDVWEHAYYLKYQNRRAEFVDAVMDHLVDWDDVAGRYQRVAGT
jgi:Fe-Mn family superoxide dismutase